MEHALCQDFQNSGIQWTWIEWSQPLKDVFMGEGLLPDKTLLEPSCGNGIPPGQIMQLCLHSLLLTTSPLLKAPFYGFILINPSCLHFWANATALVGSGKLGLSYHPLSASVLHCLVLFFYFQYLGSWAHFWGSRNVCLIINDIVESGAKLILSNC